VIIPLVISKSLKFNTNPLFHTLQICMHCSRFNLFIIVRLDLVYIALPITAYLTSLINPPPIVYDLLHYHLFFIFTFQIAPSVLY